MSTPDLNPDDIYAILNISAQNLARVTSYDAMRAGQIAPGEVIKRHLERMTQFAAALMPPVPEPPQTPEPDPQP